MSLIVENLPENYSKESFAEEFNKFGQCKINYFVRLTQERSAFVEYEEEASASEAISTWNNRNFNGYILRVEENYLDSQYLKPPQGQGGSADSNREQAAMETKPTDAGLQPHITEAQPKAHSPPEHTTGEVSVIQNSENQEGEINQDQQDDEEANQQEEQPSEANLGENTVVQVEPTPASPGSNEELSKQPSAEEQPEKAEEPAHEPQDIEMAEAPQSPPQSPQPPQSPEAIQAPKTPEAPQTPEAPPSPEDAKEIAAEETKKAKRSKKPKTTRQSKDSKTKQPKDSKKLKDTKSSPQKQPAKKRPPTTPEPRLTRAQQAKAGPATRQRTSKSPSAREPVVLPKRRARAESPVETPRAASPQSSGSTYVHLSSGTVFDRLNSGMLRCRVCLKEVKQQSAHSHVKTVLHKTAANPV